MLNSEVKARIEELEAVAEHVPPGVLAGRLLSAVEDLYEGDLRTIRIALRMEDLGTDEAAREIHRRTRAALESAEALAAHRLDEIARLEDTLREERIAREERPAPEPVFDPGVPASAADRAAPETSASESSARATRAAFDPEERSEEEHWQEMKERDEEIPSAPEEPAEDTKTCMGCGGKRRPLSEFRKDGRTLDGYSHYCERHMSQSTVGAKARHRSESLLGVVGAKSPEAPPEGTEDGGATPSFAGRCCARGMGCVAADPTDAFPEPAILDAANPGPLCRRCQKRAGVA